MAESVLVLGESLVDVVHAADGTRVAHAGGSPANVAVALSRLGIPVELATAFGADDFGVLLERHFAAAGVRLVGERLTLPRTSSAVATIDPSGEASYQFDISAVLPLVAPDRRRIHVHTGSIGALLGPGGAAVAGTIETHVQHATVSYDVNVRPAVTGSGPALRSGVERLARRCDLVKASDEDLAVLYPGASLDDAARRLLDLGPVAVVVTEGGDGSRCYTRDEVFRALGRAATVVDTIGAGDAFAAALVDGLNRRGCLGATGRASLRAADRAVWGDVLDRANTAAAISVSRGGASPPTRAELDQHQRHLASA